MRLRASSKHSDLKRRRHQRRAWQRGAQDFLISLVRDRRFTDVVNDVVVEWGNSRYQDVIDRFVNGEDGLLEK